MLRKLLWADFLKIKRKGFWLLSLLGPVGVIALQMVNYGVRKDYLLRQSEDDWAYYLLNVSSFTPLAIVLGIAILTAFTASVEDETNAWKQLLALPVSKMNVYLSKFTMLLILLLGSSVLLAVFTLLYGVVLDLGEEIPVARLLEYSFFPFLAALPVLALHVWIALVSRNQGIPITVGIVGTILTYSAFMLPDWLIWKWPSMMNDWNEPVINVWLGIGAGLVIYVIGMMDFVRRDAK